MTVIGIPSRAISTVSMPELVGSKAAPDTSVSGEVSELAAHGGRRPRPPAGRAVDDAEQRPDRKLDPVREPAVDVLKPPVIHPHLPAPITLPVPDQNRTPSRVDVGLRERQRLGDPQAPTPQHRDHRPDS